MKHIHWFVLIGGVLICGVPGSHAQTYRVLHDFGNSGPTAVALDGTTLYGATSAGGTGNGTLFKLSTNGAGYLILKTFSGLDGASPMAGVITAGNTLFGTTAGGGTFGHGTLYKVDSGGANH